MKFMLLIVFSALMSTLTAKAVNKTENDLKPLEIDLIKPDSPIFGSHPDQIYISNGIMIASTPNIFFHSMENVYRHKYESDDGDVVYIFAYKKLKEKDLKDIYMKMKQKKSEAEEKFTTAMEQYKAAMESYKEAMNKLRESLVESNKNFQDSVKTWASGFNDDSIYWKKDLGSNIQKTIKKTLSTLQ